MGDSVSDSNALAQALERFRLGDANHASRILARILASQPEHFDALHLAGVIKAIAGAHDEAEMLYRRALRINGNHAELRMNLTLALAALGKFDEALTNVERALELGARRAATHFTRGNILRELERRHDALASFDTAIAIDPGYAKALMNRGVTLGELGRHDDALVDYAKALVIDPHAVDAWTNRGIAFSRLRRYDDALASYDKALAIDPGSAETWSNRGNVLGELKRHDEALASFDKAIAINPGSAEFWSNRGNVLGELKRYDAALACFDKAIGIDSGDAEAWYNRGLAFNELDRHEEALASFDRALAIEPATEYCSGKRVLAKLMLCDWRGIEDAFNSLRDRVDAGARACDPFSFLAVPSSLTQQRRCAEVHVQSNFPGATVPLYAGERYVHDRIRVAYLSADFHNHATAYLMAGLFEAHDRTRFETIAISFGPDTADEMRARLRASFERFIDVRHRSDREVASLLREAEIDIVVDLKGYTRDGRPGILAYRAAPIQISYLGYPGTLGADYVDYVIGDRHVVPAAHRTGYAEKIAYLPHTYQVNDSGRVIAARAATRADCKLPETGLVFCCFNNLYKITPEVFDIWMRLLGRIKGSVLWLMEGGAPTSDNLRGEAKRRDVAPERLVFAPRMKLEEHLARHRLADLFLDTLPYNAHTTASDALWAGLPVLTCTGPAFAGRVATSLLHAVGLPELITESLQDYEATALDLATDPSRLPALRDKLARNRLTHPLFDTASFTRHIESAFSRMWERHQAGLPPDHIHVEA